MLYGPGLAKAFFVVNGQLHPSKQCVPVQAQSLLCHMQTLNAVIAIQLATH